MSNENVSYLYHAVSGSALAVSGDPNQNLLQSQSWCLSGSLTSGPGLWQASAGSSNQTTASSDDWFSELDCNQSNVNCQFLQQLTVWAFWTLDSRISWIQSGVAAVFRWRDVVSLAHEGLFPSGVRTCVQDLAAWLGQWWSWMEGFSVDLKYQGLSERL